MNRENMLRLRAAVKVRDPKRFNYRDVCRCVLPILYDTFGGGLSASRAGLAISDDEISYLIGYDEPSIGRGKSIIGRGPKRMLRKDAIGRRGIREALRRIDVILARDPEKTARRATP